jgi:hypothetical protein
MLILIKVQIAGALKRLGCLALHQCGSITQKQIKEHLM